MASHDLGAVSKSNYFERWASDPVLFLSDSLDREWVRHEQPHSANALLLGSGPGRELLWLRGLASRITCIDSDQAAVDQGRHSFGSDGITWLNSDLMTYPFEEGSFDLALGLGLTFAYVQDLNKALAITYCLLKADGLLVFSLPNTEHPHEKGVVAKRKAAGVSGRHSFHITEVRDALRTAGFSNVEIKGQRFILDFIPSSALLNQGNCDAPDERLRDLFTLETRWSHTQSASAAKILWVSARKPDMGR